MIKTLCYIVVIASAVSSQSTKTSPCPNVFTYDPPASGEKLEPGTAKWYGTVNLSTDTTLYALWLNIILDNKASILGNWVGEVTTEDNLNFKIENTKMKLSPGAPIPIRFFIQYNSRDIEPKLISILFNGREICNVDNSPQAIVDYPISIADNYDVSNEVPIRLDRTTTTVRPTTVLTTRNVYDRSQTKSPYRQTTTVTPSYWTQTKGTTKQPTTDKSNSKYETPKNLNKTQITSSLWNWSQPTADTQPAKHVDNTQTKNKDQRYTTSPAKDLSWSRNKTLSAQNKTENKVQPAQSTSQSWSSKTTNNQQIKSDKLQITTESNSRVTSKPQTWVTVKAENNQQVTTENKKHVDSQDNSKFQLWSQIKVDNEQVKLDDKQASQSNHGYQSTTENSYNKGEVWSPPILESNSQTSQKNTQSKTEDRSEYYSDYNLNSNRQTDTRPEIYEDASYTSNTQNRKSGSILSTDSSSLAITQSHTSEPQRKKVSTDVYLATGSRDQVKLIESDRTPVDKVPIRTESFFEVRPIKRKESESITSRPIESYTWTEDPPKIIFESAGSKYTDEDDDIRGANVNRPPSSNVYQLTTERTTHRPTAQRPAISESYDADYPTKHDDFKDPGFVDMPMFYIPNLRPEISCGKVTKKPPRFLPYGATTSEGQWPWQAALYQQQTVDFKYICGGTLVSHWHVITAAHCVTRKKSRRQVNKNTLTVYLGKFNLRTSVEGVQVKFVNKIIIHPQYNASIFSRDLAILELREQVSYTDWVRPACLWPENEIGRRNIVGKKGSVVGWGFDVAGVPREELNLLEMPVVDQETCINSYIEFYEKFTSDYTYCAGYKDGTSVCNGDSGGGMVFKKGNNWYLRGLASLSIARHNEYRCDPKHYVIFTDIAKFLPWIEENILVD